MLKLGEVNAEFPPLRVEVTLSMQLLESRDIANYDASSRIVLLATILEAARSCFSIMLV